MPLLLRKAIPADAPLLTEIYLSAFQNDAISLLVFPRNQSTRDWWTNSVLSELSDPNAHFVCIYDSSSPNNEIVAYCKWNSPSSSPPPGADDLPTWPEGADRETGNYFFGKLSEGRKRIMEGRKHWYLEFIATKKEWQGKGAGGMLIGWGLERADEEGVESYLEASPEGLPIYKRFGFQEVERFGVDLRDKKEVLGSDWDCEREGEFVEVFMTRGVKKGSEVGKT